MRSLIGTLLRNESPVPFVSRRLNFPHVHRNDTEAQLRAMGAVGTLFAIVDRSATAASQVNWRLYRKAPSGHHEDRTEITTHPAIDLWNQPNPFYSRQLFVESLQQHMDLVGESDWVIGRHPASPMPLELWLVRPDRIAPVPHATKFISGWLYHGPDGEKVPLESTDVIQVRRPNPLDPYRGMGPVQSILADVDSTRYSAEWNRNFFLNSAEPGGIVEVPERLSDDEFEEHRQRWAEQHQGIAQAHRVAILEGGMKWVERSFNQRDMQFVELRNVSREVIREAFGFPKPMLGATDDVNRANAEAAEVVFSRWFIGPRLDRIKGALNNQLLPLYGKEAARTLEFDYDDPTPESAEQENAERTSKSSAAQVLVAAGWAPAEVLEVVGLPEMTWVGPPTPPPAPAPAPAGAVPPPARAVHHHHHHPRALTTGRPRNADDDAKQRQLETVQEDWQAILDRLMGDWADITAAQRAEVYEQVAAAVDAGDPAALAEITVDTTDAAALLHEAMVELAAIAAARVVEEAAEQDVDIDPVEPDSAGLGDFAAGIAALLGQGLAAAAGREAMRRTTPGATGEQVAGEVDAHLEQSAVGRATEDQLGGALSNAQNTARIETLRAAPVAAYYADETLDRNTCENCREVDGKWLGNSIDEVEEVYPNGGYKDCLGRERCRGTVTAVWRPEQVRERP